MRAAQYLGGAGAAAAPSLLEECEQRCRWRPYSKSNELEANAAVVLIVLLCCLICAVALNAAIRCFLRGGGEQQRNDHNSKAEARTVEYREGMEVAGAEAECAICLSDFEEGEAVHVLGTCKHAFHVDCIDKWFRSRPSCPTCRCSCRPPPESDPELAINPTHQVQRLGRNH